MFTFDYPSNLPISEKRKEIKKLILENQVVIISGETGSGKTTQIPKICLELGLSQKGIIGHTQPRRLAAQSVSHRIAEELKVPLGKEVGFHVRFNERYSYETKLKVMTDGIMLSEIEHDPLLKKYSVIIIDEAHERSLNIDFLLGYIKTILKKRNDLKVIITSATIDLDSFKNYFKAPVLEVSGRTFPVSTHYFEEGLLEEELSEVVCHGLEKVFAIEKGEKNKIGGDVLVFLPGERDIREAMALINKQDYPNVTPLPLYSRLNNEAQRKIFKVIKGSKRVILSTNVAETSITVPNIRYVIDSGLARVSRYSPHQKVQRLPIEKISQASANQRKGRAGRVMAGHCIRLYEENDFLGRAQFTQAEVLRTNLSQVILKALSLNLGRLENFPFIEKPELKYIRDGFKVLRELKAVNEKDQITSIGRKITRIPLDPRLAKMILSANFFDSVFEAIIISSALSIQDPRETPREKKEKALQFHRRFQEEGSDFLSWLNLWDYLEDLKQHNSKTQFRKKCREEFLNYLRINEWQDLVSELLHTARQLKLTVKTKRNASTEHIHQALLSGLLSFVGRIDEKKSYRGPQGTIFHLFPGSSCYKRPPEFIMASEMVETSKLFVRQAAAISSEWVIKAAQHLLRFQYSDPFWSTKRGEAFVYQQTSLYGVVLESKKRVRYAPVDKTGAREIFIREALVLDRIGQSVKILPKVWLNNQKVKESVLQLEARVRRHGILKSEDELFSLFDKKIPKELVDVRGFLKWLDRNESLISFRQEDLIDSNALLPDEELFPGVLKVGRHSFKLQYAFSPGGESDGVSVFIPKILLAQLPIEPFSWLVPGLLPEKIESLIKSLPKKRRKQLFPIDSLVNDLVSLSVDKKESLEQFIIDKVFSLRGIKIEEGEFCLDRIDDYYKINFIVLDESNKPILQSRDLNALKGNFNSKEIVEQKTVKSIEEKKIYHEWTFSNLDREVLKKEGEHLVSFYPALKDEGDSVSLALFVNKNEASVSHLKGLVRLATFYLRQEIKYLEKNLFRSHAEALLLSSIKSDEKALSLIIENIIKEVFFIEDQPRSKEDFLDCIQQKKGRLIETAQSFEQIICLALKIKQDALSQLSKLHSQEEYLREDLTKQVERLFEGGFLFLPYQYLKHYPRYLKAVTIRLDKAKANGSRDKSLLSEIKSLEEPFFKQYSAINRLFFNEKAMHFRFLLEELRVSYFAQGLKTSEKVSYKKLTKMCANL